MKDTEWHLATECFIKEIRTNDDYRSREPEKIRNEKFELRCFDVHGDTKQIPPAAISRYQNQSGPKLNVHILNCILASRAIQFQSRD
jgi:hypothetical protein